MVDDYFSSTIHLLDRMTLAKKMHCVSSDLMATSARGGSMYDFRSGWGVPKKQTKGIQSADL